MVRDCQCCVSAGHATQFRSSTPRTSCSAGRSAGLDLFALNFSQTEVGINYRNWRVKERNIVFSKKGSLAGAVTDAPGVLSEFSSRTVDFGIFEINYYVVRNL